MNVAIRTTSEAFKGEEAKRVECGRILAHLADCLQKGVVRYPEKGERIKLYDRDGIEVGTCRP